MHFYCNEKIKARRWCLKRGRFPFLGGRCLLRREMRSKRGSLPPKEGDLTCMVRTQMEVHYQLQHDLYLYAPKCMFLELNSRAFSFWPVYVCLSVAQKDFIFSMHTKPFTWHHCQWPCDLYISNSHFGIMLPLGTFIFHKHSLLYHVSYCTLSHMMLLYKEEESDFDMSVCQSVCG